MIDTLYMYVCTKGIFFSLFVLGMRKLGTGPDYGPMLFFTFILIRFFNFLI